jgi:hypothetical protein
MLAMIFFSGSSQESDKKITCVGENDENQVVAFTNAGAMAHCLPWFLGYLARQQNNSEAQALHELIVVSVNADAKLERKDRDLWVAKLQEAQGAYNDVVGDQVSSQVDELADRKSSSSDLLDAKEEGVLTSAQQVTAAFSSVQNLKGVFAGAAANIREQQVQNVEGDRYIETIVAEALIHNEGNVIDNQNGLISRAQYSQIVCQESGSLVAPFEVVVLCHAAGIFKDQSQRASFESLSRVHDLKGLVDNTATLTVERNEWKLAPAPNKDNKDSQTSRIEFLGSKAVNVVAAYKELVDLHKQNHAARAGGKRFVRFGVGSGLLSAAAAAAFFLAASGPALPIVAGVLAVVAAVSLAVRFYRRGRYSDLEAKRDQIESAMDALFSRSAGPAQAKMIRFHQSMLRDEGQRRYAGSAKFDRDREKLGETIVNDPNLYIHRGRNYRAGSDQTEVAKAQASAVVAYIRSGCCDWSKLAEFLSSDKFKSSQRFGCGWLGRATREGKIQAALQAEIEKIGGDNSNLTSGQASSFLAAVFGENGAAFHLVGKDVVARAVEKAFQVGGRSTKTLREIQNSPWYQGAGNFFSEDGYGAQKLVTEAFNSVESLERVQSI